MKVRFENEGVDVWKLRKGVVLGCGSEFVHLNGIRVTERGVKIFVEFHDREEREYFSDVLEWLEPH